MDKEIIKCQNCDYIRKIKDYAITPEWQCPKCKCDYKNIKSDDYSRSGGSSNQYVFAFICIIIILLFVSVPLLGAGAVFYFIPTLIALNNNHQSTSSIFALNLFLGFTFIAPCVRVVGT